MAQGLAAKSSWVMFGTAVSLACAPIDHEHAQADDGTALMVVRSLVGEAGPRLRTDHPAILRVYEARHELPAWRDRPMRDLVEAYSAPVRRGLRPNANRTRVLRITPETAPVGVLKLVMTWLNGGEIADPCHGATHFGSPTDAIRSGMPAVRCTRPTRNVFLRQRPS